MVARCPLPVHLPAEHIGSAEEQPVRYEEAGVAAAAAESVLAARMRGGVTPGEVVVRTVR